MVHGRYAQNIPLTLISSFTESSDPSSKYTERNTYRATGIAIATILIAVGGTALLLPGKVGAFWPFSTNANAADTDAGGPLLHDASIDLLKAATNSDPNPNKGGGEIAMTEGSALIANTGPDGTVADIQHVSSDNTISTYTVKDGDTLSSIAAANGISVNTIRWANNLAKTASVKPGQTLVILPVTGIDHKIQKGETVESLAKKYNADAQDIRSYNGLDVGDTLVVGTTIIIPNGELPASEAAPKAKAKKYSTSVTSVNLPNVGGYFSNPLPGGICTQGIHDNNAVDIGAPAGTPIYAAAAGSVLLVNSTDKWYHGWGYDVVINHPNGTQTLYAHMSQTAATTGSDVSKGELIGYVGRTGKATGNHLHFEVHKAANPFCSNL